MSHSSRGRFSFACRFASIQVADKICTKNRHYAEYSGYWVQTEFIGEREGHRTTFYDSVSGKPLFIAPKVGRCKL